MTFLELKTINQVHAIKLILEKIGSCVSFIFSINLGTILLFSNKEMDHLTFTGLLKFVVGWKVGNEAAIDKIER